MISVKLKKFNQVLYLSKKNNQALCVLTQTVLAKHYIYSNPNKIFNQALYKSNNFNQALSMETQTHVAKIGELLSKLSVYTNFCLGKQNFSANIENCLGLFAQTLPIYLQIHISFFV